MASSPKVARWGGQDPRLSGEWSSSVRDTLAFRTACLETSCWRLLSSKPEPEGATGSERTLLTTATDRAWAIFVARTILGTVFFIGGVYKVFIWGPIAHARVLFIEPYSHTFLPL